MTLASPEEQYLITDDLLTEAEVVSGLENLGETIIIEKLNNNEIAFGAWHLVIWLGAFLVPQNKEVNRLKRFIVKVINRLLLKIYRLR